MSQEIAPTPLAESPEASDPMQFYLDELALGRESPEARAAFDDVELGQRRFLLAAFHNEVRNRPELFGDLTPFSESWNLLLKMEEYDQKISSENRGMRTVNTMLLDPATGEWLTHVLRRLRLGDQTPNDPPLWVDVGYFNSLVAGYAHLSSLEIRIPVRQGRAFIPDRGTALFPPHKEWDVAALDFVSGKSQLVRDNYGNTVQMGLLSTSPNWEPVQGYTSVRSYGMRFNHDNPYATAWNSPPDETTALWQAKLEEAISLLQRDCPNEAEELMGIKALVPMAARNLFEAYSSSASTSIGLIEASLPRDTREAAVILLHEYAHSKLNKALGIARLVVPQAAGGLLYAPWRDDPRPAGGLVHGVYAFSVVADFWQRRREIDTGGQYDLADFEFGLWRDQVINTLDTLYDAWSKQYLDIRDAMTPNGARFIDHMDYRARSKANIPVRARNYRHIQQAKYDHEALWRAYHVQPDPEAISVLADSWLTGRDLPPIQTHEIPSTVTNNTAACRLDGRAILARHFMSDRLLYQERREAAETRMQRADIELATSLIGNVAIARQLYTEELAENPLDPRAFVGYILSSPQGTSTRACRNTAKWSEVILATQAEIIARTDKPAPYDTLAKWIDQSTILASQRLF